MSSTTLCVYLETLRSLDCETEVCHDILSRSFDTCLKLHDLIEDNALPSDEKVYQDAGKTCIKYLEKCTHMVNQLDLFSSKESVEEIQTSSIKYLMLPALLGNLNLAQQGKELLERLEFLQTAEVYFKDFLLRCKNYELSKRKLINAYEKELLEEDVSKEQVPNKYPIIDFAAIRESKFQECKLRKELKDQENELKPALERDDAEDSIREYYFVILERWMLNALGELSNIDSEKSVREYMIEKKGLANSVTSKAKKIKPLRPIIITRNEIQKEVFGLDYPSIPVVTIDDFYHQTFEKMIKEQENIPER